VKGEKHLSLEERKAGITRIWREGGEDAFVHLSRKDWETRGGQVKRNLGKIGGRTILFRVERIGEARSTFTAKISGASGQEKIKSFTIHQVTEKEEESSSRNGERRGVDFLPL